MNESKKKKVKTSRSNVNVIKSLIFQTLVVNIIIILIGIMSIVLLRSSMIRLSEQAVEMEGQNVQAINWRSITEVQISSMKTSLANSQRLRRQSISRIIQLRLVLRLWINSMSLRRWIQLSTMHTRKLTELTMMWLLRLWMMLLIIMVRIIGTSCQVSTWMWQVPCQRHQAHTI